MKDKISYTIKLDEETLKKAIYIANFSKCTPNNHIVGLIRTNIAYHERVHGRIPPKELENISIENNN